MRLYRKIHTILTPIYLMVATSSTALADTFIMKDGTSFNATVIRETYSELFLKAEISKNAFTEKTIKKEDIKEIIKVDISEKAYEKIAKILPTKSLMTEKNYENIINSKIKPFLRKYPESNYRNDVKKILTTLKNEQTAIKKGGVKLDGQIYTAKDIEADQFNFNAKKAYYKFNTHLSKKQYRAALSALELLENGYQDTPQCRNAQKAALKILPRYEEKLKILLKDLPSLTARRKRVLDEMPADEKFRTKNIFKQEETRYQQRLDIANYKKAKWLPTNPYFKEPIEKNLKIINPEITRINTETQKPTIDNGKLFRSIFASIKSNNTDNAKKHLTQFKKNKPPKALSDQLETQIKEAELRNKNIVQLAKQKALKAKEIAREETKKIENELKKLKLAELRAKAAAAAKAQLDKEGNKINTGPIKDALKKKFKLDKRNNRLDSLPR